MWVSRDEWENLQRRVKELEARTSLAAYSGIIFGSSSYPPGFGWSIPINTAVVKLCEVMGIEYEYARPGFKVVKVKGTAKQR